jgi:hypothetical protein
MDVPGPQVFWMSEWDRWLRLAFQVLAISGPNTIALVNTGPPADLSSLNSHVQSVLGPRAGFRPSAAGSLLEQLQRAGIEPIAEGLACYARTRPAADHVSPLTDPRVLARYPRGLGIKATD